MSTPNNTRQWLVEQTVRRLVADWSSRDEEHRPWGTWVLLWGAIESDDELEGPWPAVPLLAAWFLTESGFVRRDMWSYLRHRAMQYSRLHYPLATRVAVLEVAPYRGRCAVYAAGYYGPRNAHGMRLELDTHGQPTEHRIWVA
ncbi:hypothetical protein [Pyxidicoccus caerfyrddinensis]|uniref:hypothetical protein n=1 Tax=Pyxidicoccus caerfyrddinensis TaxID=2709663 RepID=UPI0013DBE748|nr:hypothetical protein [Pyxidicoccus caerfyrddinensis]